MTRFHSTETGMVPFSEKENAEWDAKAAQAATSEYARMRADEYPSFADQFDLLYHGGMDAWKSAIQAVKDKYPKPE